ncbi:pre-mRNA 3'-end-processing factor FIP1-like [Diachasmimorpha longicaudata]|uniref:pre-mRNA 3'-end-processing factor FIP1-like n=1 Tax=Diachasmimorpha longicaudata TaxID=58733 RepID=UPI0030B8E1AC
MADENEDQWLYGDSIDDKPDFPGDPDVQNDQEESAEPNTGEQPVQEGDEAENIPEEVTGEPELQPEEPEVPVKETPDAEQMSPKTAENGTKDPDEEPSDSDSDDDVHVVIGDIKSTPAAYNSLNLKRGNLMTSTGADNLKKQSGKFSIDDFETIGVINGTQAHEFNLDQLEDKPWRQPGADITDYFNYGFNEETWRAYCERQKRMRSESGVGLILNAGGGIGSGVPNSARVPQVAPIANDNSKHSSIMGPKRAGPPPGRKMGGTIDVIGSSGLASRRNLDKSPPKENVIQVMTADRREYSRKPGFPDMSVPPPAPGMPPTFDMPPPGYAPEPPPFYMPEPDPYYQSYEPTQDSQWGSDPTWQPTNLAIPLTEHDDKDTSPKTIPTMVPPLPIPPLIVPSGREQRADPRGMVDRERRDMGDRDGESTVRERDRERVERDKDSAMRDRDRDSVSKDDDKDRDRSRSQYRHKERHRHRSRSRSRRHKSRSRSPTRRKKKSRRSDRERSKEDSE